MVAVGGDRQGAIWNRTPSQGSGLEYDGYGRVSVEGAQGNAPSVKRARSDALPENTRYVDTGCDMHPSCLTCPLVRCRYDQPGGARRLLSDSRDRSMVELRQAGHGVEEIASRFGVSRRTVFRALAKAGGGRRR